MQKLFMLLCTMVITFHLTAENTATSSKINWITSYEDAVSQSKATSKPILLFFTGSDYCSWCHKLEAEVFNTSEFGAAASDKFIFVMLDFPASGKVPANLAAQNKELKNRYGVRGFPTIILVDSKGQKIGETGYRQGGGKQYAEYLFKMLSDFSGYQQKLSSLDKQNFSGQELKQFYEKAQEFGLSHDVNKIMILGFSSDQKQFFLLEKYRFLASEGQHDSRKGMELKKQLLESDFQNEQLTHYHVAIIDFEALASSLESHKKSADSLVAPLTSYIDRFGKHDKTNLWRLHMIISQVYYDKDQPNEALKHAQLSFSSAPTLVQPEIEIVIKNIQQNDLKQPLANSFL